MTFDAFSGDSLTGEGGSEAEKLAGRENDSDMGGPQFWKYNGETPSVARTKDMDVGNRE